jgi:putative tricarboxylic transport membrane protein
VELTNWRAVFAPPDISDEDKQKLADAVGQMVESETWQNTLKERAWLDLYLPPDEFAEFLAQDRQQVETVLKDIGLVQQ